MKLRVTSVEPPDENDGKDLPVVHFRGISRSMHPSHDPNANSDIRGEEFRRPSAHYVIECHEGVVC